MLMMLALKGKQRKKEVTIHKNILKLQILYIDVEAQFCKYVHIYEVM